MARKKETVLTPEERMQAALVPDWEWPYRVPENWCWITLDSVTSIIMGQSPPGTDTTDDSKYTPLIGGAADMGDVYPKVTRYTKIPTKISTNQDLILCIRATLGRPVYSDKEYCLGRGVAAIRPHIGNLSFYKYFFNAFEQYMYDNATGTTFPQVSSQILQQMPLPFPPLPEQQRIADRIESLFAKLDEAKQKAQNALDSFETRKAAILHKAFTGELTAQWRKEHSEGLEGWKNLTLNDVAEYKKGPFGSSITKAMFVPKGNNTYKVYEQGNAIRKTVEYGHYYISEQKYLELKTFSVSGGDIIISCAGTIGEVFKLPDNCERGVINQALMRVRIFSNIEEQFFIYYFGGILKGDVIDKANGTAIKNIPPFKILKAMRIDLPPFLEQTEIVRILDGLLAKEQQAQKAAEAVIEQIDLIKKSILARAFRGELGTNDPAEESAVELVKQILKKGDETVSKPKARMKRIVIPAEIKSVLSNANEEEIIKVLMKSAPKAASIQTIMSISRKKFELMDALRSLEKKQLVFKTDTGEYLLMR